MKDALQHREYETVFNGLKFNLDLNNPDLALDKVSTSFSGSGRNEYRNNIQWFESDPSLHELMKTISGLTMCIEYDDYSLDHMTFCCGKDTITCNDGQVVITNNAYENLELTRELYLQEGLGEAEDWEELVGDDEDDEVIERPRMG